MIERFWPKVSKTEGCWFWDGAKDLDGYGFIKRKDGAQIRAHRFIFEHIHNTVLTSKDYICHKCDNPSCVRPDHLFLGNAFINSQDMIKKGRKAKTGGNPKKFKKFSDAQIKKIRESKNGANYWAQKYNVSKSIIYAIRRRKTYKHVC